MSGLIKGYGIYFDPVKNTSGQKFYSKLITALSKEALELVENPSVVLFNISAPIKEIIKAKIKGQKVVIRVDGLYFDRLSTPFISTFKWPLKLFLKLCMKNKKFYRFGCFWANFFNENLHAFARIIFANHIIYQSKFSHNIHSKWFKGKPFTIINNGDEFKGIKNNHTDEIRIVTIYDEWRPSKRVTDVIMFAKWANERNVKIRLSILGYTGVIPQQSPNGLRTLIESSNYIKTYPKFSSFTEEMEEVLYNSDCYMTFTYRDACPNTVVEAMAYGLPVLGADSGGMKELVGDAGYLLKNENMGNEFYVPHRYESDFPPIDYEEVLTKVKEIKVKNNEYKGKVRRQFETHLGIQNIANEYSNLLNKLVNNFDN